MLRIWNGADGEQGNSRAELPGERVPSGPQKPIAHTRLLKMLLVLYKSALNARNKYFRASQGQVK